MASIVAGGFVGYKVTGIDTALADLGRTDGNKPGLAGTGFITGFAVDGKIIGTGCVGRDTQTTAIYRTGKVMTVTGPCGSGTGT